VSGSPSRSWTTGRSSPWPGIVAVLHAGPPGPARLAPRLQTLRSDVSRVECVPSRSTALVNRGLVTTWHRPSQHDFRIRTVGHRGSRSQEEGTWHGVGANACPCPSFKSPPGRLPSLNPVNKLYHFLIGDSLPFPLNVVECRAKLYLFWYPRCARSDTPPLWRSLNLCQLVTALTSTNWL